MRPHQAEGHQEDEGRAPGEQESTTKHGGDRSTFAGVLGTLSSESLDVSSSPCPQCMALTGGRHRLAKETLAGSFSHLVLSLEVSHQ